jgi:hypothetical protein
MSDDATAQATADAAAATAAASAADAAATTAATADAGTAADASAAAGSAAAAAPVVPEKYDIKVGPEVKIDAAIIERTAATARALGLSNDAAQKLLDGVVQEAQTAEAAALQKAADEQKAFIDAWSPGGAKFVERDAQWKQAALADPEIGGTPEKLAASVEQATQALKKYGSPELEKVLSIDETGFGQHPAVLKFLARIGKAMGEGEMIAGSPSRGQPAAKTTAEMLYGPEGTGPKAVVG